MAQFRGTYVRREQKPSEYVNLAYPILPRSKSSTSNELMALNDPLLLLPINGKAAMHSFAQVIFYENC